MGFRQLMSSSLNTPIHLASQTDMFAKDWTIVS
jgi:hypothetical protein